MVLQQDAEAVAGGGLGGAEVALVTQLVMGAEREPATRESMELNFLSLDLAMVEGEIDQATAAGADAPVELQRRRADLAERIAHFETSA